MPLSWENTGCRGPYRLRGRDTIQVKGTRSRRAVVVPVLALVVQVVGLGRRGGDGGPDPNPVGLKPAGAVHVQGHVAADYEHAAW